MIHTSRLQPAEAVRWRGNRGRVIRAICGHGCWRRSTAALRPRPRHGCFRSASRNSTRRWPGARPAGRSRPGRSATGRRSSWRRCTRRRRRIERFRRSMVASRPEVTLAELRAWLLARHQVTASLGLMHRTLARLGLTLKTYGPPPLQAACASLADQSASTYPACRHCRGQDGDPRAPILISRPTSLCRLFCQDHGPPVDCQAISRSPPADLNSRAAPNTASG